MTVTNSCMPVINYVYETYVYTKMYAFGLYEKTSLDFDCPVSGFDPNAPSLRYGNRRSQIRSFVMVPVGCSCIVSIYGHFRAGRSIWRRSDSDGTILSCTSTFPSDYEERMLCTHQRIAVRISDGGENLCRIRCG